MGSLMDPTRDGEGRDSANRGRCVVGDPSGYYESFFLRANHPTRPRAFWIRYTTFSPRQRPDDAVGELWAIYFDGESGTHVAAKREVPLRRCRFGASGLDVAIGDAVLGDDRAVGAASSASDAISWDLAIDGGQEPLLLLPASLYEAKLPRAKSLVPRPLATFRGVLRVNGREVAIDSWVGSQNHNWGSRHTDLYAWGQVAGFDESAESFFEVATARLKFGPLWAPAITVLVLRHGGEEIRLNSVRQGLRARGVFGYFHWDFESSDGDTKVKGRMSAPRTAFVGLRYANPPGGEKSCLNTKIATCELTIERGGRAEALRSATRAAFEILTDDRAHGVALRV